MTTRLQQRTGDLLAGVAEKSPVNAASSSIFFAVTIGGGGVETLQVLIFKTVHIVIFLHPRNSGKVEV